MKNFFRSILFVNTIILSIILTINLIAQDAKKISKSIDTSSQKTLITKTESPKAIENTFENTLAIIKPDAVGANLTGEIIKIIELNGFNIKRIKKLKLTTKQAQNFYKEHKNKPFYNDLVNYMTSGPIMALELEKENAVKEWRDLMGSTNPAKASVGTIRKMYGKSIEQNAVHGSDAENAAKRELKFFFNK